MTKIKPVAPSSLDQLNLKIDTQAPLAAYTTFRLGGPTKGIIHCETPEQLEQSVKVLAKLKEPFILIGGGSNLLVSDQGIDRYVIRYVSSTHQIKQLGSDIVVSGSTIFDDLALWAAENGLAGLNSSHGIPGTVGGAIVGNAGAFGKQIGDITKSVTLLSVDGKKRTVLGKDLQFTYRNSRLKESNDIVLEAQLSLTKGDRALLLKERAEILTIRKSKHPNLAQEPCAGSFFRNIEPTSKAQKRQAAGWFLEEAGAKKLKVGGAVIYPKHANIIIRADNCRSQDVFDLSLEMKRLVKEKFGLELVREVRLVGEFKGRPKDSRELIW